MNRKGHEEIMKDYYPYTEQCPLNGVCIKEKCKYWIEDKKCWDREFEKIVYEIFGGRDFYHYNKETPDSLKDLPSNMDRFIDLWIHVYMCETYGSKKDDFTKPPTVIVELGFNSRRLAEKVKIKFNLNSWEVTGRNEEGGDEHSLTLTENAFHADIDRIVSLFKNIKEMLPKIIEYEREINACQVCGKLSNSLTDYEKYAVCEWCEGSILEFLFKNNPKSEELLKKIRKNL